MKSSKKIPTVHKEPHTRLHPVHVRIAKGMMWVVLFVFLGKLVGAAKEMAIAYRFGVSGVIDAYILAFTIVTWLPTVWQSVLQAVLVPIFVHLSEAERRSFYAELMGFTLLAGIVLSIVIELALPLIMAHMIPGLSGESASHVTTFVRGLAPVAAVSMFTGLLFTRLLAGEHHTSTLMEGVPALCILLAVIAWPGSNAIGNAGALLFGTLVGFGCYVGCLWLLLGRVGIPSYFRWTMRSPYWRVMWQGLGYMTLGQLIISLAVPIDQVMAAKLGEGAIATLGYGNRVLGLALSLGATAIGRAILPVLSGAISVPHNAWNLARRWALILFLIGGCGVLLLWMLAPVIVRLLFERGIFTPSDTARVVEVFRYGLVQIPFYFPGIVFVQFLVSYKKYIQIACITATILVVKIAANIFLMKSLGVSGIALATGFMYVSSLILCTFVAYYSVRQGD